jgi:hypothetical protein
MTRRRIVKVLTSACTLWTVCSVAQRAAPAKPIAPATVPPARVVLKGCVSKLPKLDRYVLAAGTRCILLGGDVAASKAAGHIAQLSGHLRDPAGSMPLTLELDGKLVEVGAVCAVTCTLAPPGTRGIESPLVPYSQEEKDCPTKVETPGTQGGTPGARPKDTDPCKMSPPPKP